MGGGSSDRKINFYMLQEIGSKGWLTEPTPSVPRKTNPHHLIWHLAHQKLRFVLYRVSRLLGAGASSDGKGLRSRFPEERAYVGIPEPGAGGEMSEWAH